MSVAVVFYIVAILAALTLFGSFLVYKFKYIIWKGYFRAEIICEDGDIVVKTLRLKQSDNEFTAVVKGKVDTYHIMDRDENDRRRVYRIGRFRLPKAFYNAHQYEPIDMQHLRKESQVSATRHREIAKNTVTSQLLNAFSENNMREAMAVMLAVGIVVCGLFILGYFLNNKLDTIVERLG